MSKAASNGSSLGKDAWRRFRKNKLAMTGASFVLVMAIMGYSAPLIATYVTHFSLDEQHNEYRNHPPGTRDISKDHTTFDGDKSRFDELDLDGNGVIGGQAELLGLQFKARFYLFLFDDHDIAGDGEKITEAARLKPHPDGYLVSDEFPLDFATLETGLEEELITTVKKAMTPEQLEDPFAADRLARKRYTQLGLDRASGFATLDGDGDQIVTSQEVDQHRLVLRLFEAPTNALALMDGNGDGNITREEYPGLPELYTFYLGTDHMGRDVFTRILYGARISISIALLATFVSFLIGVTWGSVAGFYGGRVDNIMMRIVDVMYGLPFMFIVILLIVIFGRSTINLFIALGAVQWLTMSRVVRGQVISLKEREFVEAARAIGVPNRKIVFRHLLRNTVGPVIVYSTLMVPAIILEEAFLSFLGLGVQPPNPSWGNMITDGARVMSTHTWLILYPGLALSLTLFSMNFVGDGLRDALDPQMQKG
ncbi:MAG: oligopeptide transport system permease protein [Myxococcota bacterium]|jgi:oligopeptide transport system permease protein